MGIVEVPVFPYVELREWISWMEDYFIRKRLTDFEKLHIFGEKLREAEILQETSTNLEDVTLSSESLIQVSKTTSDDIEKDSHEETNSYVADSLCEIDQEAGLRCKAAAIESGHNADSVMENESQITKPSDTEVTEENYVVVIPEPHSFASEQTSVNHMLWYGTETTEEEKNYQTCFTVPCLED
ncbi:hypothetical protein Bca52824_022271 [Brassica carinata]|uniref:Uncharacterized protein n=1 Tax=Brassica carinata TaxID=52824 RepID=A0A8X7VGF2_BRACI|nr:hypothetical protein Bca52824_022271 [Brassica carinata]